MKGGISHFKGGVLQFKFFKDMFLTKYVCLSFLCVDGFSQYDLIILNNLPVLLKNCY